LKVETYIISRIATSPLGHW